MNRLIPRLIRLLAGLFLYALGVVFTLNADIGYSPWDVFHAGVSSTTGISIGNASITVGLVIILLVLALKEKIGLGTILNMIIIGLSMDFILWLNIVPKSTGFISGVIMLITGMFIVAVGSCFYIGSALGAGPRDSLMVALTRKTSLPVGLCRSAIEFFAVGAGYMLGGKIGAGTVISVVAIGFCVQLTFKALKFVPTDIRHETLTQTYKNLNEKRKL